MSHRPDGSLPPQKHSTARPTGELAVARENFLTQSDRTPDGVRHTILTSWQRSAEWNVTPDAITAPFNEDLDTDARLVRAAHPTLERLESEFSGQPVSVVLTNADGYVLDRRTGIRKLERRLDEVYLAQGFSYAEHFVGTNGIGTALEAGQPTYVYQQEHYTEQLGQLACAGVPVYSPTTRQVEGLLDITCWADDASPLLMAMARSAAESLQAALMSYARGREVTLLNEYLETSGRCLDPVLAFNGDVLMLNEKARQMLSLQDQTAVSDHLCAEHLGSGPLKITLPSGVLCRVYAKHVYQQRLYAGTLARLQFAEPVHHLNVPAAITDSSDLPGITGSGALWKQAARLLDRDFQEGNWSIVEGETGAGKLALIQAIHRNRSPHSPIRVFDAADTTSHRNWIDEIQHELDSRSGTIVIRHLERLRTYTAGLLNTALRKHTDSSGVWVTATVNTNTEPTAALAELRDSAFARSVEVPPLRHHTEDIEDIAPFLLQQLTKRSDLSFSPAAMRTLLRRSWPGNIAELRRVVQLAAKRTRAGSITVDDLPPECRSQNRRVLNPIESMERDAIVRALTESGNNRAQAARSLGISRATIYRKIKEYGIVSTPGSH
jgi:sigma-54 dependent transcriptional regulator, acetoin dehydrogenase operon transcriptional activator AcoR